MLGHPDASLRSGAVLALASILPKEEPSAKQVLPALSDSDWTVRRAAAQALGKMGPPARSAVPTLFKMLESETDRDWARQALRDIDDAEPAALPILIAALKGEERSARYYAVFFLKKLGPAAKDALPDLRKLAEDDSRRFRDSVQAAIASIEAGDVATDATSASNR